jgi:hypothetical protein
MGIVDNALIGASGQSGYNLTRSLRTRSSATAWLNRSFAAGNRKTWTLSTWVKRGTLGSAQVLFSTGVLNSSDFTFANIGFNSNDTFNFTAYTVTWRGTTQVFRDPSAWYHIVLAFDTTQATAANRVKLYVNGTQVTAFASSTDPTLNTDYAINQSGQHYFGYPAYAYSYFDGYKAETYFIDGQALTPSSFGSTNAPTGVWQPAPFSGGSYGTNGFYLPFTDNSALTTSSNVGLGKDFSGNGNYWTTNNISLTSGVTYDSMTDVPTLTSATAANFAVLNPLRPTASGAFSNGNLTGTAETGTPARGLCSTIVLPYTGKWYAEVVFASHVNNWCGVTANDFLAADLNTAGQMSVLYYAFNGNKYVNGTSTAYGASYTTETIGIAFDGAAGTITFYKSNVSQGAITLPSSTVQYVFVQGNAAGTAIAANWNFGQRPFTYTPPTGFVSLNTYNLPDSTIVKGNTVMDATLYTGTGAALTITNAAPFKPDLVWIKVRSNAFSHALTDSVRGISSILSSDLTSAQATQSAGQGLTAFNSNGFSLGTQAAGASDTNFSGRTYVGWQWQAGQGSSSSNTDGSITSTVSVNASAGFSVITFNGTGAAATVGHGLGVAPAFYIAKYRSGSAPNIAGWACYHSALTSAAYRIDLNSTSGQISDTNAFNGTAPTSSVLSIGTNLSVSSTPMVVYAWTPIAGFSAFGKYTGNGSTSGPFVYTGFQPKFVLVKRTNSTGIWFINDAIRDPYNSTKSYLQPQSSIAELSYDPSYDFVSNGFKIRNTSGDYNASGGTYIYMAFAENPFKNSLAR